jgi:hypothetical protein
MIRQTVETALTTASIEELIVETAMAPPPDAVRLAKRGRG